MSVDEMPAGRELDALVAEKVMGWDWYTIVNINILLPPNNYYRDHPVLATPGKHGIEDDIDVQRFWSSRDGYRFPRCAPHSTDIAAAWQVVEKIIPIGEIMIDVVYDGAWCVTVGDDAESYADTASLAICRAALKAMGITVDP